ncbi:Ger(x)C family spore germination protein [Bacillus sp. FJAT-29790]|uniref:Ger(x)C family spore germination protein n=1 Tax=Bacillus sp. FJAT-29790 TaxID=1895002 RepID=UPI001C224E80|nr:Ger(x)C family spore germination protein [Bacillus sp. FJAT-29790]MBU8880835.1 Ger(x)C family spore germination protein [Bacillus sp. FJAT-29790]
MRRIPLLLLVVVFLSGCVQPLILDDLNVEVGVGYDLLKEKKFRGTVLLQEFNPDKSILNKTYVANGDLRRDILANVQKQTNNPLVTGGILVSVFGEKLAKEGIIEFVDAYQRDASIGARNLLATTEGLSQDLMQGNYGTQGTAVYLFDLIDHNMNRRDVPKQNLHVVLRDYYQEGKDIYLPRLKMVNSDVVKISGISLFKLDKEVDVIPANKMFFFKLLVDKYSTGSYKVHLKNGKETDVESIKSKQKVTISKKDPSKVTIDIKIKGVIREYTGTRLNSKIIKEIGDNLEKEVERECLKLVKQFQEKDIDPIGLGHIYKTKNRGFDFKKWKDNYKNLEIKIICNVTIVETGGVE